MSSFPVRQHAYQKRLEDLFQRRRFGQKRSLQPLQTLLKQLQHPEQNVPLVQIAGTNGKGSTASFLSSILQEAGYSVGLFTSPHLIHFEERFQIQGQPLPWQEVDAALQEVLNAQDLLGDQGQFFDLTTATAMLLFARRNVDIVLAEAGMGGAADATSALPAILTILTNVGLDHSEWLGDTLEDIAREKAGIARPHTPFVCGTLPAFLRSVVQEVTDKAGANCFWELGREFHWTTSNNTGTYRDNRHHWTQLALGLPGGYQHNNAALAVAASVLLRELNWNIDASAIRRGLLKARWFGRWEPGFWRDMPIVVDGAHNPPALQAVLAHCKQAPHLVFGCMKDKDVLQMLLEMKGKLTSLHLFELPTPRTMPVETLANLVREQWPEVPLSQNSSLSAALENLYQQPTREPVPVVVCGSLFLWEVLLQEEAYNPQQSLTFLNK